MTDTSIFVKLSTLSVMPITVTGSLSTILFDSKGVGWVGLRWVDNFIEQQHFYNLSLHKIFRSISWPFCPIFFFHGFSSGGFLSL